MANGNLLSLMRKRNVFGDNQDNSSRVRMFDLAQDGADLDVPSNELDLDRNREIPTYATPSLDAYRDHIGKAPRREDHKPGKIESILAGIAGFSTGNASDAYNTTSGLLNQRFDRAKRNYDEQGNNLKELSDIESESNVNNFRQYTQERELDREDNIEARLSGAASDLAEYRRNQIKEIDARIANAVTKEEREKLQRERLTAQATLASDLAGIREAGANARTNSTNAAGLIRARISAAGGNNNGPSASQQTTARKTAIGELYSKYGNDQYWRQFFDPNTGNIVMPRNGNQADYTNLMEKVNTRRDEILEMYRPSPLNTDSNDVDLDPRQQAMEALAASGVTDPSEEEIEQALEDLGL